MPFLLIMPSYNQSHYIGSAIDSILAQKDPDWELWIVDNSKDDTPTIVQQYKDARIKFFHIPERMDPGTCLNWALERAEGRDFSYVHTDNLLDPEYVGDMRQALADDELSVAYCDMRTIDDDGKRIGVFRRGSFDLPRLLSLSSLGVPFSATTALAKQLGGFSTSDVADDILFCVTSYGIARLVHLPKPLMDYRLHAGSRTTEHGGASKMEAAFMRSYIRALPQLEARGLQPLLELARTIQNCIADLDLTAEDWWYRTGRDSTELKLAAPPSFANLWSLGWFRLPDLKVKSLKTLRSRPAPAVKGGQLDMISAFRSHKRMRGLAGATQEQLNKFRSLVLPWAAMKMGSTGQAPIRCWLESPDVFTVWAGYLLQKNLNWIVHILPEDAERFPFWLNLQTMSIPDQPQPGDCVINLSKTAASESLKKSGLARLDLRTST